MSEQVLLYVLPDEDGHFHVHTEVPSKVDLQCGQFAIYAFEVVIVVANHQQTLKWY